MFKPGIHHILLLSGVTLKKEFIHSYFWISFSCWTCPFTKSAEYCPETKWLNDLFWRVDSISPLYQTNMQQFERAIKWKWEFEQLKDEAHSSLRACECSAKMCDSLFHGACTKGTLAGSHRLLLLYTVYTSIVPDAWDLLKKKKTIVLLFLRHWTKKNKKQTTTLIPLLN